MDRYVVLVICGFLGIWAVDAAPKMRVYPQTVRRPLVEQNLPANWTEIREEIADTFSCDGKSYGYYADVDNDCQVFHVCLPVEGRNFTFKWSFICPGETIFNQQSFTCARTEDALRCEDAPEFYNLNDNFGQTEEDKEGDKEPQADKEGDKKDEQSVAEEQPNSVDSSQVGSDQTYTKRRNNSG